MLFRSTDLITDVVRPLGMCDHSGCHQPSHHPDEDDADPTRPDDGDDDGADPTKMPHSKGQGHDPKDCGHGRHALSQLRAQLREALQEQSGLQ